jgi:WD40 repeat protein
MHLSLLLADPCSTAVLLLLLLLPLLLLLLLNQRAHNSNANMFGSVGDDKQLLIWDINDKSESPVISVPQASTENINAIAFSPNSEFLLATGGNDMCVTLWDLRNMSQKMHVMEGHQGDVYQVYNKHLQLLEPRQVFLSLFFSSCVYVGARQKWLQDAGNV